MFCSGQVQLPGFDDDAMVHISPFWPLNPAKALKSQNWGIYERFCRDNPFLNEWSFCQVDWRRMSHGGTKSESRTTSMVKSGRLSTKNCCAWSISTTIHMLRTSVLAWYCPYCDDLHQHEIQCGLSSTRGVAFGEFYCVLMAKDVTEM